MSLLFFLAGVTLPAGASLSAENVPSPVVDIPHWRAPPSPDAIGCYHYTNVTGWLPVACTPDEVANKLPPPTEGESYGLSGLHTTSTSPTHAETFVSLASFGGESDSTHGTGAFSIQTNTNFFPGSNGDTDSVQFTVQTGPSPLSTQVCVWNIDTVTSTYTPTCVGASYRALSSTYQAYVDGDIVNTNNLKATFCLPQTQQCWSKTASDIYGLHLNNHWQTLMDKYWDVVIAPGLISFHLLKKQLSFLPLLKHLRHTFSVTPLWKQITLTWGPVLHIASAQHAQQARLQVIEAPLYDFFSQKNLPSHDILFKNIFTNSR